MGFRLVPISMTFNDTMTLNDGNATPNAYSFFWTLFGWRFGLVVTRWHYVRHG